MLYFETLARYASFFKDDPNFFAHIITKFFSPQAILHKTRAVASRSLYIFLRLLENYRRHPVMTQQAQVIADSVSQVIEACEGGKIAQEVLGDDEINYLYNI